MYIMYIYRGHDKGQSDYQRYLLIYQTYVYRNWILPSLRSILFDNRHVSCNQSVIKV